MKKKLLLQLFLIFFVVTPIFSQVSVIGSNAADGVYTTLGSAFNAINAQDQTDKNISIELNATTSETTTATLNAGLWQTLKVYPTSSDISISGNISGALITLNGADNVNFDGRINQSGNTRSLTITNTNNGTNSSTIQFLNSAESNLITNCIIKGASSGTAKGTIHFSTSSSGNGNDNNTISNNSITNAGTGRPVCSIISNGTALMENDNITIINNDIYDFMRPGSSSYGVNVFANSHSVKISGNSFYETTPIAPTASTTTYSVFVRKTTGVNFEITDNYIGGTAPQCGGGYWTKTNEFDNSFQGIYVSAGNGTSTKIENNTIKKISWKNTSSGKFYGINVASGNVDIGTMSGNTIGSSSGNGSIYWEGGATGAAIYGIYINDTTHVNCNNNTIGSLTGANADQTCATNIYGIWKGTYGNSVISNNQIGSNTTTESLLSNSASTGNAQLVFGIYSTCSDTITIKKNKIGNLSNLTTNTTVSTVGRCIGITSTNGIDSIIGNVIHDITCTNLSTASNQNSSVIGISLTTATRKHVIGNIIYNLTNSNPSFTGRIFGIYHSGSIEESLVSGNFIYNLSTDALSSGAFIYGIRLAAGNTKLYNNIVYISNNNAATIYGLSETGAAGTTNHIYLNTVHISGAPSNGSFISSALHSNSTANSKIIINNQFVNTRSNNGASGAHYAIYIANKSGLTIDYNNYLSNGTGGLLGFLSGAKATLALFKAATLQDLNSYNTNPGFENQSGTTAESFKTTVNLTGTSGGNIPTFDYGMNYRAFPTLGAWEFIDNIWTGAIDTDWNTAGNWSKNSVPTENANIWFAETPQNHCVLSTDISINNITNTQSSYYLNTNGKHLKISGTLNFTNSAKIDASSSGSVIELAGPTTQIIQANSFLTNTIYDLIINNASNIVLSGELNIENSIVSLSGKIDAITHSPILKLSGSTAASITSNTFTSNCIYDLIVDNTAGITFNADTFMIAHNLTINAGKTVIIPASKRLHVIGTIINNAGASGLTLKASSSTPNATLIFHNSNENPVSARVEMYSKAAASTYTSGVYSNYKWQYFGIPVKSTNVSPCLNGSYVRVWNEPTGKWTSINSGDNIYSFTGYEITQPTAKTITFEGILENKNLLTTLTSTPGSPAEGKFMFANPYTAAIDIKKINFGSEVEATVYLYNTGSYTDWTANGSGFGNYPGQYFSIPQGTAGQPGIPSEIPSMQGFFIKNTYSSNGDYSFEIPYSAVTTNSMQMKSQANNTQTAETSTIIVDIKGSRFSDRMWLISHPDCSQGFDNGWDGPKLLGSSSAPQLYVMGSTGDYQVATVNDINNTNLGFKTGESSDYIIRFTNYNTENQYAKIYLVDLYTNSITDVTESGSSYSFSANQTTTPINRFKIVTSFDEITGGGLNTEKKILFFNYNKTLVIDNQLNEPGLVEIMNISGQTVFKNLFKSNSLQTINMEINSGTYIVRIKTNSTEYTKKVIL